MSMNKPITTEAKNAWLAKEIRNKENPASIKQLFRAELKSRRQYEKEYGIEALSHRDAFEGAPTCPHCYGSGKDLTGLSEECQEIRIRKEIYKRKTAITNK